VALIVFSAALVARSVFHLLVEQLPLVGGSKGAAESAPAASPRRSPPKVRSESSVIATGLPLPVMAAPPSEIDWSALSPAARETVVHVSMREAAGFNYREIAEMLQEARPAFKHLTVAAGKGLTASWVASRARELRHEIERVGAARR
jgi:hypothetical protein